MEKRTFQVSEFTAKWAELYMDFDELWTKANELYEQQYKTELPDDGKDYDSFYHVSEFFSRQVTESVLDNLGTKGGNLL